MTLRTGSEAMRVSRELASAAPWAEGDAYDVLGDLHRAGGDLDGAEAAYRRARELGWDPRRGLARLLVARGKARAGLLSLQRSLSTNDWTFGDSAFFRISTGSPCVEQASRILGS